MLIRIEDSLLGDFPTDRVREIDFESIESRFEVLGL